MLNSKQISEIKPIATAMFESQGFTVITAGPDAQSRLTVTFKCTEMHDLLVRLEAFLGSYRHWTLTASDSGLWVVTLEHTYWDSIRGMMSFALSASEVKSIPECVRGWLVP